MTSTAWVIWVGRALLKWVDELAAEVFITADKSA